jgi:hypothetical protein
MKHDRRCPVCRDDGDFCLLPSAPEVANPSYKIQTLYANGVSISMWTDTGNVLEVRQASCVFSDERDEVSKAFGGLAQMWEV